MTIPLACRALKKGDPIPADYMTTILMEALIELGRRTGFNIYVRLESGELGDPIQTHTIIAQKKGETHGKSGN